MDCPKCIGKLQKKDVTIRESSDVNELRGASITYDLELDQCFVCGGVWFDKGELDKYTTEKLTVIDSPSVGADLDQKFDSKEGKCPRCQVKMNKVPYEKSKSIILDTCPKCGGFWLDSTEIDRVERAQKPVDGFLGLFMRALRDG